MCGNSILKNKRQLYVITVLFTIFFVLISIPWSYGLSYIVGNGAYFAPDLTKIYEQTGPAWLLAYLGSPGAYPTEAVVNIQLNELIKSGLPVKVAAVL